MITTKKYVVIVNPRANSYREVYGPYDTMVEATAAVRDYNADDGKKHEIVVETIKREIPRGKSVARLAMEASLKRQLGVK